VLERTLAMAHPLMPFVTEEIWSYLPDRRSELIVTAYPAAERGRIDDVAEAEVGEAIELTRALRRWRELAGVSPGATLSARAAGDGAAHPLVARLARLELGAAGDSAAHAAPVATVGAIEILASEGLDPLAVSGRLDELRDRLRGEVERAEGKLANQGFVANAPSEVVEAEREKLERYRSELEELA
jgi:valyl-tRNA synthetase